jgi:hypothetical protein
VQSAPFSAVIITAELMFTVMSEGKTEASAMKSCSMPITFRSGVTTLPIPAVAQG